MSAPGVLWIQHGMPAQWAHDHEEFHPGDARMFDVKLQPCVHSYGVMALLYLHGGVNVEGLVYLPMPPASAARFVRSLAFLPRAWFTFPPRRHPVWAEKPNI